MLQSKRLSFSLNPLDLKCLLHSYLFVVQVLWREECAEQRKNIKSEKIREMKHSFTVVSVSQLIKRRQPAATVWADFITQLKACNH